MEKTAPLFKGATRPACIFGIPMKPFMGCMCVFILLVFWVWMPLILGAVPSLFVMNRIAKEDDQRFRQLFLFTRINLAGSGNKHFWGAVSSFSPVSYKRSK